MKLARLLPVLAVWAPLPTNGPDHVRTITGQEFSGNVVYDDGVRIVLRERSQDREFDQHDLEDIRTRHRSLDLLLVWLRDAPNDADTNKELALFARKSQLPGLERLFWLRVLQLDSSDDEANSALEHRERRSKWEMKHGRGWWTFEERAKRAENWEHAWEIDTLHFHLRSNLALPDVAAFAFDLEQLYSAYYDLVRPALPLFEVQEKMTFHIHADLKSFPEVAESRRSYFDIDQNVAHINSSRGMDRATTLHEAVHAIIHNTRLGVRGTDLPPWLDEGLAEYFRASASGRMGRAEFELGKPDRLHFADHANAPKPYGLKRVLNLGKGDFMSSTNTQLKYAQSYTLVHFLLEGEGGALRPRFFRYLQWCYEGRGSSTHFKEAIDRDLGDLEQAWLTYVAGLN